MTLKFVTGVHNLWNGSSVSTESDPNIAVQSDGTIAAVWLDRYWPPGGQLTYTTRYELFGESGQVKSQGVYQTTDVEQTDVVAGPSSSFLIAGSSPTGGDVSVLNTSTGTRQTVNSITTADQSNIKIEKLSDGTFVAAWVDQRDAPADYGNIYARHLDSSGMPVGSDFLVASGPGSQGVVGSDSMTGIDITPVEAGFAVAWVSNSGATEYKFSIFNSDNSAVAQGVSIPNANVYEPPHITTLGDGKIAVAYETADDHHVNLNLYSSSGALEKSVQVDGVTSGNGSYNYTPGIVALSSGGLAVAWASSGVGLRIATFDSDGALKDAAFNVGAPGQRPDLAELPDGHIAATWELIDSNGYWNIGTAVFTEQLTAPALALAHDTGSSGTDLITNDASLSVTGLAPGSIVQYSTDAGKTWSADFSAQEGVNTLIARQVDSSGQISSNSAALTFTLDTKAPGEPTVGLTTDTGSSPTDGLTNDAHVSVAPAEAGGTLAYSVDGNAVTSYDPTKLADGQHTVAVTQTDAAGNVSQAGSVTFTLDKTAPSAPTVSLANDTGSSKTDGMTKDASITVAPAEQGGTLSYSVDGNAVTSYDPTKLADGQHTVAVTQTDAAGNVSQAGSVTFTLDTKAPDVPTVTLATDSGSSPTDGLTNDAHVTVTSAEQGGTLAYSVDGGAYGASYDPSQLKDGQHTVSVEQTDAAGNTSQAGSVTFTLDKTAPSAPTVSLANDTGSSKTDGMTKDAGITVAPAEQGGTLSYSVDGNAVTSYDPTKLADGQHTVAVTQTDAAGNVSQAGSVTFTLDTKAPDVPTVTLATDSGSSPTDGLTNDAHLTVTPAEQGGTLAYSVDGGAYGASYDPSQLKDGQHTVSVEQTDAAGNTSQAGSVTFTLDTKAPNVIGVVLAHDTGVSSSDGITSDPTLAFTGLENGAHVEYSSDGKSWGATSLAHEGGNDFFVRQVDLAGNAGASTEFKFNLDTTAPVPTVTDLTSTTISGASEASSTVSVFDGATLLGTVKADATGAWSLAIAPTGSITHSYTETATDIAGNVGNSAVVALYTPAGNKSLVGGSGDDVLFGRPNDTLTGGAGHDIFVFNPNFGKETVTDFTPGADVIQIARTLFTSSADALAHAQQVGADVVVTYSSADSITLKGVLLTNLHTSDFQIV